MKTIFIFITTIIPSIIIFCAGYYFGGKYNQKEIIIEKPVQNIVYRQPAQMKRPELETELNCYYTSDFIVNWNKLNKRKWKYEVKLCDRRMEQSISIPVAEYNGWKFTVGIFAIGFVVGAGAYYEIDKRLQEYFKNKFYGRF
jgi:hypothetical protein